MAAQEEENGVERVPSNGSYLLLRDLRKSQGRTPLEVNIVGKGECRQCGERRSGKEVGCGSIWVYTLIVIEKDKQYSHFRGTVGGLPQPLVRFPEVVVHRTATCAPGLMPLRKILETATDTAYNTIHSSL